MLITIIMFANKYRISLKEINKPGITVVKIIIDINNGPSSINDGLNMSTSGINTVSTDEKITINRKALSSSNIGIILSTLIILLRVFYF